MKALIVHAVVIKKWVAVKIMQLFEFLDFVLPVQFKVSALTKSCQLLLKFLLIENFTKFSFIAKLWKEMMYVSNVELCIGGIAHKQKTLLIFLLHLSIFFGHQNRLKSLILFFKRCSTDYDMMCHRDA